MAKILVIEDSPLLRNDLLETLALEGFDVRAAENGLTGIEVARQYQPDLILCDVMMPELDGYGVLDELRKDPLTSTLPFIFMTAKSEKSDIRLGMELGADDYLTKPFLTDDLLRSIYARLTQRMMVTLQAEHKLEELRQNIITALPHELRTPLNAIIGFSEMMITDAGEVEPDKIPEWAHHIHTAGLRLYRLFENYLTFVRLELLARNSIHYTDGRKPDLINQPESLMQHRAVDISRRWQRESDLVLNLQNSGAVRISKTDFAKLLEELVDNAFKFSQSGTPVEVATPSPTVQEFLLLVTNRGRGMTSEQIAAVGAYVQFERWLYEQQGMGLGLAIARRIVELAGGTFSIESVPNQHTTICVRLPRK